MEHIVKVQKGKNDSIISFETSEGRIISYQKALMDVQNGLITGAAVEMQEDGTAYLTNMDQEKENFLDLPPIF